MKFDKEVQSYKFQGIIVGSLEIISSHYMEKLLKKVILSLFPNSIPYKKLRHPMCRRTFNPFPLNIKWFFPLLGDFRLPVVFMIIPFPLSQEVVFPIFVPIVTPFPQKMKLKKLFNNFLAQVLSALVQAPTLLLWSWYLRKKVLGRCVLTSAPSTNSPLKINFPSLSLMTSLMN
jgi:hypothetical protein